jgi:hypothetical protein
MILDDRFYGIRFWLSTIGYRLSTIEISQKKSIAYCLISVAFREHPESCIFYRFMILDDRFYGIGFWFSTIGYRLSTIEISQKKSIAYCLMSIAFREHPASCILYPVSCILFFSSSNSLLHKLSS